VRVLYGIQCTGNGHITRSINIINELRKHVTVDVVTSGSHSEVPIPFTVLASTPKASAFWVKEFMATQRKDMTADTSEVQ